MPDSVAKLVNPAASGRSTTRKRQTPPKLEARRRCYRRDPDTQRQPALKPTLATLVDRPPPDPDKWIYESSLTATASWRRSGLRSAPDTATVMTGPNSCRTCSGIAAMKLRNGWAGRRDRDAQRTWRHELQQLQNAFDRPSGGHRVFPLRSALLRRRNLTAVPLEERRDLLRSILTTHPHRPVQRGVRRSPAELVSLHAAGSRGDHRKASGQYYSSGRTPHWIKLKCAQRQSL